jgi:hypothetical protein
MFRRWVFWSVLLLMAVASALAEPPSVPSPVIHFAVLGDRTGEHQPGIYERAVAQVERLRPDFVLTVGDHIEGYTDDTAVLKTQWDEYFSIVKALTMPLYLTPGNHDITTDAALPMFRKVVGEPYRSFDIGELHFIILDNSRWDSSDRMPKEQMEWLTKDLQSHANAGLTFVFFHKPFWYNSVSLGKPDTLHSLFVKYGVDAVFSGHFHQYFSGKFDGILYTAIGSSGALPDSDPAEIGYHIGWVTVDHGAIEISPIKVDGVKPWDVLNVADLHLYDKVTKEGVRLKSAAPVAADLTVPATDIAVEFHNAESDLAVDDTIRWTVPSGWSVTPQVVPLALPANGSKTMSFQVKGSGALYPVPKLEVKLPYKQGKLATITHDLLVARTAHCYRASKAPVIDGKLSDAAWRDPVTSFFTPGGAPATIESTYCYFAYDRDNLYVAARCCESQPDSIRAFTTKRDGGLFGEDCLGLFLQPDPTKDTVFQIYFNVLASVFDQRITLQAEGYFDGDKSWNGTYEVKSVREPGYWSVEARIPLKQLGIAGKKGMTCGLNFLRKQQHRKSAADWQAPIDYNPQTFGVLKFE